MPRPAARAVAALFLPAAAGLGLSATDREANVAAAKQAIKGLIVPVLTHYSGAPREPSGSLPVDHAAVAENVRYLVSHGVTRGKGALLAAASGGDFPVLSTEERMRTAETIVNASRSGVGEAEAPAVLVCVQDTNIDRVVQLAQHAEQIGAWGIQLSVPYYWGATDDDALRWFERVHNATSSVGILFYNVPWEGYEAPVPVLQRLADKLPRLVGLKWAVGAPVGQTVVMATYMQAVAQLSPRYAIVDNMEVPVMNHMLGGTGYVTHLATVWPEHQLKAQALLEAGNYSEAQAMFSKANWPWYNFRVKMGGRTSGESPSVKAALEIAGRHGGPSRQPSRSLTAEERAELQQVMHDIGVPGI